MKRIMACWFAIVCVGHCSAQPVQRPKDESLAKVVSAWEKAGVAFNGCAGGKILGLHRGSGRQGSDSGPRRPARLRGRLAKDQGDHKIAARS